MPGQLPVHPPRCPNCKNNVAYYSRRKNLFDWLALPFGGRPYRCRYCNQRFIGWLRNWHPALRFLMVLVWLGLIWAALLLAESRGLIQLS